MAQDRSEGRLAIDPERERERYEARKPERIERAREIVLNDDGEVIAPEDLDDALREHGVEIGTSPDGYRELRNAADLPTALIHMAVDTGQDPGDVLNSGDVSTS
jgi:hypothetical protein